MEALMKCMDNYDDDDDIDLDQLDKFNLGRFDFVEIAKTYAFLELYRIKNGIKEIYMPVHNNDNYEVSNYGNVRKKSTMKIMRYTAGKFHHFIKDVTLKKNGKKKNFMVWYLQLRAFERV